MPSKSAEAVTKTLTEGLSYLPEYLNYISRQDLMNKILIKTLNDLPVWTFFGHISEKIEGSNRSCLKLCKRAATEALHFLESAVSSGEHGGITVRRLRDSGPLTYTYSLSDEIDIDLIWQLFFKRHEKVFTTADLKRAKQALERGEGANQERMFYFGIPNRCESFISKLLPSNNKQEEKAALSAIYVALKSRLMKGNRTFRKGNMKQPPLFWDNMLSERNSI